MKRLLWVILTLLPSVSFSGVRFELFNRALAYNGENASYWEETRTTITYFENLIEPNVIFTLGDRARLTCGVGVLLPFNTEIKVMDTYPVVRTEFFFGKTTLTLGTLSSQHNFPAPILDPLTALTPMVRLLSKSQMPLNPYESYINSEFTHGYYEYGASLAWDEFWGRGELYMNWQLLDTPNHRERFDVGLIHNYNLSGIPLYLGFHYWHNGGHENVHPISITENYTLAIGLRNSRFSLLYLASYLLPDRDSRPDLNTFGGGLYGEISFSLWGWDFEINVWLSDCYLFTNHQFISVEGDPFYRVPFYAGLNIYRDILLTQEYTLRIGFVNGIFLPDTRTTFDWKMIRYDQLLKADIRIGFDLTQ